MRDKPTERKICFGAWAVISAGWVLVFIDGCIDGAPDFGNLLFALLCAVICMLYWQLWHEKAAELHIEIFKLPDGREIRKEHWE